MLILGKTHDYYDGVAHSTGIDKTIVYKRDQKLIEDALILPYDGENHRENTYNVRGETVYETVTAQRILFCGKFYRTYVACYRTPRLTHPASSTVAYFYADSYKKVKEYAAEHYGIALPKRWHRFDNEVANEKSFDSELKRLDLDELHRIHGAPVLRIVEAPYGRDRKTLKTDYRTSWFDVETNPVLRDCNFARLVDPFTAFQEIAMYLSGVMGVSEKEIVVLNDKEKIAKHGMDKWSFRKMPVG